MMPTKLISRLLPFAARRRRQRFEARLEAHLPALTRLAGGLIRNPVYAEDLVHDSCLTALTSGAEIDIDSDAKLCEWLNRILVNTCRNQYRRNQRLPLRSNDYHASSDDCMNVYELVASSEQSPVDCIHDRDSSCDPGCVVGATARGVRGICIIPD